MTSSKLVLDAIQQFCLKKFWNISKIYLQHLCLEKFQKNFENLCERQFNICASKFFENISKTYLGR